MYCPQTPFDSIESAQEYLKLLSDSVSEAKQSVEADLTVLKDEGEQITRALQLISYNLEKLGSHIKISRRILNDLFLLRRVILQVPETNAGKQDTDTLRAHLPRRAARHFNRFSPARKAVHP